MGNEITKNKVISSLFWKLLERSGTQVVQFIVMLVLARILLPEDFGLLVLVSIFITIGNVFVQSGFSAALIQKKDADELDFSSVFYISIFLAILVYVSLFFLSPYIANFFAYPEMALLIKVLSLSLFISAYNSIQNAFIARTMQFKKLFFSTLTSVLISGSLGIILAYAQYGVWAIVAQQLTQQLLVTINLMYSVKWYPKWLFSFKRITKLYSFGWKLLLSSLMDTFYNNIRSFFIGKMFSPTVLGFYNRGEQFPSLLINNINGSIQAVMFPTLASEQNNKKRMKELVRRAIVTSSFIVFPMMVGLIVIAEPLILLLLTDKWLPAVPFLQISCISYALWPIHTANLQAINALGRSDVYLKLEIIKVGMAILILMLTIPLGIYAIAWGTVIGGFIAIFLNALPNYFLLDYSVFEQLQDIMPSIFISLIMGACIYTIHWLHFPLLTTLILQVIGGLILYILLAKLFRLECFVYLFNTTKELFNRKRHAMI